MAWSVHRVAHDVAAQDRWIALAVLVSLLLHSPLLLWSGAWRVGPLDGAAAPLQVLIESQEDQDPWENAVREEAAPGIRDPARPASEIDEAEEPSDPTLPSVDSIDAAPAGPEMPSDDEDFSPRAEGQFQDLALVPAADGESDPLTADDETVAIEPLPPASAVVASINPAEEALLTRRLVREARELLAGNALQGQLAFDYRDRRFTVDLTRRPAVDGTGIERVAAEIVAEERGERMQTRLQMKRLTFSHFTQLVDRWDESVLLHDDEISGRFHSNSEIPLTYDHRIAPRLLGKVTTTHGVRFDEQRGWRSRREIFAGGLETRSPRIRLPRIALPVASEVPGQDGEVHVIRSDTLIVFHDDGDYDCVELASRGAERRHLLPGRPTYLIGGPDAELRVRGIVNGSVTVYSPKRIVVQGNLTYAHGAAIGGEVDDYLGLVSDGNVEIDRGEVTGPGDLAIHAAVYARRRFVVRDAGSRGPATLFIYGSLTAGSLARTEPRYGTRIEFDPRFEHARPPGFPETDRYEVETWDGRWSVAPRLD